MGAPAGPDNGGGVLPEGVDSVTFALYLGLPVAYVSLLMSVAVGPILFCVGWGFVPDVAG